MEWICIECGSSVLVADRALVEAMNWEIPPAADDSLHAPGNRARCPLCRKKGCASLPVTERP